MAFKPEQKEEKKLAIVKAAARVFSQKGFGGANMADVAAEAGIGKGTIYEYFDSKDDLFFTVFEWYIEEQSSAALVGINALTSSAADKIRAISDALMNAWVDEIEFFGLMMEFWSAAGTSRYRGEFKNAFNNVYREFKGLVAELIREGAARGEFSDGVNAEATAAGLVGAWDAFLLQAWFDDEFKPLPISKDFLDTVLHGMSAGRSAT